MECGARRSRLLPFVQVDMSTAQRDLMAPDTEPTDEELALVMREARDEVVRRNRQADEKLRLQIEDAIRVAAARPRPAGKPTRW